MKVYCSHVLNSIIYIIKAFSRGCFHVSEFIKRLEDPKDMKRIQLPGTVQWYRGHARTVLYS